MSIRNRLAGWSIIQKILAALVALVVLWLAWTVIYRLFFQAADLAEARGERIVAEDQAKAAANTASEALKETVERYEYREAQTTIVKEGQANVSAATNPMDADAAGADALCRLHNSLCRAAPRP